MKRIFTLDAKRFRADDCVGGVLINPVLPKGFDVTPNDERPASHQKWWNRSYIVSETVEALDRFYGGRTDEYADAGRKHWEQARPKWLATYPTGIRYEVRCLDGGAWDRSTWRGSFATLDAALGAT